MTASQWDFIARHCLGDGLQGKEADSKPILFPANQNLRRSRRYRSSERFSMRSPPPLPPACELIASLFLFLVLAGGVFSPTLAEEILLYYIYWQILKIKFVTFGGHIFPT